METSLDKNITVKMLLRFAFPTIMSMVLMGVFGMVDGIFVSRILGPEALSAVNIVWPYLTFAMAVGFMIGTGGNALVAKKLGEGKEKEARTNFSLLITVAFLSSVVLSVFGLLFPDLLLNILGANEAIFEISRQYMNPLLMALPFVILGVVFQQFLMTEGKANIGMYASITGGVVNVFLNWFLIYYHDMGLQGSAIATGLGYTVPAIIGFIFFIRNQKGVIYFTKPAFDFAVIVQASTNGVSEMITMVASSITMGVMNNILMELDGPMAVASVGIIWAGQGLLINAFMGYASGISPIISFNYGKRDEERLQKIYKRSLGIIATMAVISATIGLFIVSPLLWVYDVPQGIPVYDMVHTGFRIGLIGFFFTGFNTFSSAMFTALNNGKVSGILSFFRTLVFILVSLWTLPQFFGVTGVWIALPFAEFLSLLMTIYFFKKMNRIYRYASTPKVTPNLKTVA